MAYRPALSESELPVGSLRSVEIDGNKVLLIRRDDGIYATAPRCPHMGLPLDKGELTPEGELRCKFHHARFDPKDGRVCQWADFPPGIQLVNLIRKPKPLETYPVKVEDGTIWVDVG